MSEKRVALDIADVRDAIEHNAGLMFWMPTGEMPADGLTKHLKDQRSLRQIMFSNKFRLKWDPVPKIKKPKLLKNKPPKKKFVRIGEAANPGAAWSKKGRKHGDKTSKPRSPPPPRQHL